MIGALPSKLSTFLHNYPRYRYPSDLQSTLRAVSELLLIDVVDQPEVERQFYGYCESGALSQHALISRQLRQLGMRLSLIRGSPHRRSVLLQKVGKTCPYA